VLSETEFENILFILKRTVKVFPCSSPPRRTEEWLLEDPETTHGKRLQGFL
jgi:hypothetical protein